MSEWFKRKKRITRRLTILFVENVSITMVPLTKTSKLTMEIYNMHQNYSASKWNYIVGPNQCMSEFQYDRSEIWINFSFKYSAKAKTSELQTTTFCATYIQRRNFSQVKMKSHCFKQATNFTPMMLLSLFICIKHLTVTQKLWPRVTARWVAQCTCCLLPSGNSWMRASIVWVAHK